MKSLNTQLFRDKGQFAVFLKYSQQKSTAIDVIKKNLLKDSVLQENTAGGSQIFKVLDIGCGSGDLIVPLTTYLREKFNATPQVYLVEPATDLLKKTQSRLIDEAGVPIDHIKCLATSFPVDRDINKWETNTRFHFILCSHVLYYISDWEKATLELLHLLNEEGLICITLQSRKGEQYHFRQEFIPQAQGNSTFLERSAEEYCQLLHSIGVPYSYETHSSELRLPIEPHLSIEQFVKLHASNTADNYPLNDLVHIYEFLLRTSWTDVPVKVKTDIYKILQQKIGTGLSYIEQVDGFIWIHSSELFAKGNMREA